MKKIGLFYGTSTKKTAGIAQQIQAAFGEADLDIVPIESAWKEEFLTYSYLIVGTSTWFDGELPTYWDEIMPELTSLELKDKKVAIFGLGDQVNYPDNFVDGIGLLAEAFETAGAQLVGLTSAEGYSFNHSQALKDGKLLGLALDIENQPEQTEKRIHGRMYLKMNLLLI